MYLLKSLNVSIVVDIPTLMVVDICIKILIPKISIEKWSIYRAKYRYNIAVLNQHFSKMYIDNNYNEFWCLFNVQSITAMM